MRSAADHFVANRKKVEAYRQAYDCGRMKEATIQRLAYRLFDHPGVASYVETQLNAVSEHTQINAAWVLKRAGLLANFNIRRFIRQLENGTAVYDFTDATDDDWYCIDEYTTETLTKGRGVEQYEVEKIKIKAAPKLRALELVGKHIDVQAFKDTVVIEPQETQYDALSHTERSSRIAALLARGRGRRAAQASNAGGAKVATAARPAVKS